MGDSRIRIGVPGEELRVVEAPGGVPVVEAGLAFVGLGDGDQAAVVEPDGILRLLRKRPLDLQSICIEEALDTDQHLCAVLRDPDRIAEGEFAVIGRDNGAAELARDRIDLLPDHI